MASLTITAIKIPKGTQIRTATAGEAISLGHVTCYPEGAADLKRYLADESVTARHNIEGLAITAASTDEEFAYIFLRGQTILINIGTGSQAVEYVLAPGTAKKGEIAPRSDLGSSDNLIHIGYGDGSSGLNFNVYDSAITIP